MIKDEAADLDQVDRRILLELQQDGRMTNVEIARRADITAPPCLRRVRRLEESGIIRGYHADVDPAMSSFELITYAMKMAEDRSKNPTEDIVTKLIFA